MDTKPAPTHFLPAERTPLEEITLERCKLDSIPLLKELLDAMPQLVMVLDANRQIVYANRATLEALGRHEDAILGLRPGEALGCIRAKEGAGCGTTEYCTVCGAGQSLLSIAQGRDDERACRMLVAPPGRDLDFTVKATRLQHAGTNFTIFSASDHAEQDRRRALEKLFFHDVLNTAGAVSGISELLPDAKGEELAGFVALLQKSSELLLDQIIGQRDLANVESGDYTLRPSPCPMKEFLDTIAHISAAHPVAHGRVIRVAPGAEAVSIVTDRSLLMRVVGNMIKNALEAEPSGSVVQVGCDARTGGGAEIWVRNASVMPRPVQLQLFQRSFSTKGEGRGLGTFSMRILSENYLGGTVVFKSEAGAGTEFRVILPAAVKA